jgi:hypothetical protein
MQKLVLVLALACGCGKTEAPEPDPGAPHPGELTSAAGRIEGGGYRVEFQLGHWLGQRPLTGGGLTGESTTVIR